MARYLLRSAAVLSACLVTTTAQAQVFTDNTSAIPISGVDNNSSTENVDFGDVDGDGDWDAVFADGGDAGNDQNRIWINQGGAQGGTIGDFTDMTSTQFPTIQQDGRDIEFVDFDNDGDLDLYSSNTSQLTNQSNRWWVNNGGIQAGTEGFYTDETSTRWVGLGGAGSSISPSQLLTGGGFIDFSCDCDFGDLDNDGDLDLVHSSYGGVFGGQIPTRLFLNDGSGFFSEFNPSGSQLLNQTISNGDSGIWCEGTQQSETTNSDGTFCDVASSALDIDVMDIDGDFDLDILHGSRETAPRMFENRLEENGGTLGFRDVTGSAFIGMYTSGNGHYEQEMGDLDGDGDLDIYGLNWLAGAFGAPFTDITMRGLGDGTFDQVTTLNNSGTDDNEGDFLDYDLDGDLDLFVANFQGEDRLYRNNNNGGATFSFTEVTSANIPPYVDFSAISLDAEACDVDNDGDYDVMVAADTFDRNVLLTNNTNPGSGMDNHAPYIPNVEQAPDRTPDATPTVIRAHVYDNAPYYITWYNDVEIRYTVNAGPVQIVPMMSSGGQIFRGEIPGSETGAICYTIAASDEYGQTGLSAQFCYNSGMVVVPFPVSCTGDGGDQMGCTDCPCMNNAMPGSGGGCLNSSGNGSRLIATGDTSVSLPMAATTDLRFSATGGPSFQLFILNSGDAVAPNNPANPCFGLDSGASGMLFDGLRCAVSSTLRNGGRGADSNGEVGVTNAAWGGANNPPGGIAQFFGYSAGTTKFFQAIHRDSTAANCNTGLNTTQSLEVLFTP